MGTSSRSKQLRLQTVAAAGSLLTAAAGCGMRITPPADVREPATVLLLDHGYHSSLVLPDESPASADLGGAMEYAYGQHDWFAENHDQWWHALPAALIPARGTLGRRAARIPVEKTTAEERNKAARGEENKTTADTAVAPGDERGTTAEDQSHSGTLDREERKTTAQEQWHGGAVSGAGEAPVPAHVSGASPPVERVYAIVVERERAAGLAGRLAAYFERGRAAEIYNAKVGLWFVPYDRRYGPHRNCNTEVAAWLEELGCRVSGPRAWAEFEVHAPRVGKQ